MEEKALNECIQKVNAERGKSPGDLMDFVARLCEEPRWKSDEIFESLKSNLMLLKYELVNKAQNLKDTLHMLENPKRKKPRKIRVDNTRGLLRLTQSRIFIVETLLKTDKFAKRYYQLKKKDEL